MSSPVNTASHPVVHDRPSPADSTHQDDMLARIGQLTRTLHESLRELGFDVMLAKAAQAIPDTRDRLAYVARMTEQAASRVLNATEVAIPLQERIESGAVSLAARLRGIEATAPGAAELRDLTNRTAAFLDQVGTDAATTKARLMDIMMAQDFQDLTGQVITKITELAQGIEEQLVQLLIDYSPGQPQHDTESSLLNGPQTSSGAADVVANQGQVDELLDSLGF